MTTDTTPADPSPRVPQVVRDLQGMAPGLLAGWWRPVIVPPFPDVPGDCPAPGPAGDHPA